MDSRNLMKKENKPFGKVKRFDFLEDARSTAAKRYHRVRNHR
jgi:hypothetical protein